MFKFNKKLINTLYKGSRVLGKTATAMNDLNTILSGDPEKIAKRAARKAVNKTGNKITRTINKKV